MMISPERFATICFLSLMQNGRGMIDKSPDYIEEKVDMLRSGYGAFSYLDIHNMERVINYCDFWKVQIPEPIAEEYRMQTEAYEELKAKGIL